MWFSVTCTLFSITRGGLLVLSFVSQVFVLSFVCVSAEALVHKEQRHSLDEPVFPDRPGVTKWI